MSGAGGFAAFAAFVSTMEAAGLIEPGCTYEEFEAALDGAAVELDDTEALVASASKEAA